MGSSIGDEPFRKLFQSHFSYVLRMARLTGVPEPDVKDVAQEVFLALHQAMTEGRFNPALPAGPWLKTVTYRTVRARLERKRERLLSERDVERVDETVDAEQRLSMSQQWEMVVTLLKTLELDRRVVFVMHEIDEMTIAEIAEALGIPPNTVSSRLRRAREDFKEALRRRRSKGGVMVLPLDLDALLRAFRALPIPEAPPEVRDRVWGRLCEALGESGAVSLGPSATGLITLASPQLVAGAVLTFLVGAGSGAATLAALRPPPRVAAARLEADVAVRSAAVPSPAPPSSPRVEGSSASLSAAPKTAVNPPFHSAADADAADAAERLVVQRATDALDSRAPDPAEALRLLDRYEQTYPGSHRFDADRDRIRRKAQALESRR